MKTNHANHKMNVYAYATDAGSGTIKAATVMDAYRTLRGQISDEMITDGATLWVEPTDQGSHEGRITMGVSGEIV